MPFFSISQVSAALDYLDGNGHTLLFSVLAMLAKDVPVSDDPDKVVRFGSLDENELLGRFFAPEGAADAYPFFSPFLNTGTTRWRDRQYAGRTLHPIRKHNPDIFFRSGNSLKQLALAPGYQNAVRSQLAQKGEVPLSLPALAVWCYRNIQVDGVDDAVERLAKALNLDRDGLVARNGDDGAAIFDLHLPDNLSPDAMEEHPIPATDLLEMLNKRTAPPGKAAVQSSGAESEDAAPFAPDIVDGVVEPDLIEGEWSISKDDLLDLGELQGLDEPAFRAAAALRAGLHVIFTGPPGTAKTTLAEIICRKAGNASWTVPATDQWTTFETIGGYFPVPTDDGRDALDFLPGAVVDSIERKQCLIIDELNRADIDKAFGELFTLLTGNAVTLPFRRRSADGFRRVRLETKAVVAEVDIDVIAVPSWWRIIGAMNNIDKASLKRMSLAFNRRFVFVPVDLPDPDKYRSVLRARTDKLGSLVGGDMDGLLAGLVELFARRDAGFASIELPMGPGIPLAMLAQAHSEWSMDPERPLPVVMQSALEGLVASQLDGRSDRMTEIYGLLAPHVADTQELRRVFGIWTGISP